MNNNLYDKQEKEFTSLINLLKNLPKVDAPDNFEYNLMVKIQNGNLEQREKRSFSKWLFIFTPAAVTVSLILIFFMFNLSNYDDAFLFDTPKKLSSSNESHDTLQIQEIILNDAAIGSVKQNNTVKVEKKTYTVVVQNNDVVTKTQNKFPIDDSKSVDLDRVLSGDQNVSNGNTRVRLVSEGDNYYPFDEFLVKPNKQEDVKQLKARMDSLKKAANKNQNK